MSMVDAAGRLTADPCVSISDIEKAIKHFLQLSGSKDLHSLLQSPLGSQLTWKTTTQPDWLIKVAPLFLGLSELCPNTILLSSKVLGALKKLQKDDYLVNLSGKLDEDFWDSCDFSIRVLFSHFREIKKSATVAQRMMKKCTPRGWDAIHNVLKHIVIPESNPKPSAPPPPVSWDAQFEKVNIFKTILASTEEAPACSITSSSSKTTQPSTSSSSEGSLFPTLPSSKQLEGSQDTGKLCLGTGHNHKRARMLANTPSNTMTDEEEAMVDVFLQKQVSSSSKPTKATSTTKKKPAQQTTQSCTKSLPATSQPSPKQLLEAIPATKSSGKKLLCSRAYHARFQQVLKQTGEKEKAKEEGRKAYKQAAVEYDSKIKAE